MLLLPVVVSCINLAVPRLYSAFRLVEHYDVPRQEVYVLLIRWVGVSVTAKGSLPFHRGKRAGGWQGSRSSMEVLVSRMNFKGMVCLCGVCYNHSHRVHKAGRKDSSGVHCLLLEVRAFLSQLLRASG